MMMRLVFAILLLAVPAHAEWRRQGYCAKDCGSDIAQPHPLSYFTRDPFLRDDANDLCLACTDEEKATLHLKIKVRTEIRPVGTVSGLAVFDVLCYFRGSDRPDWKFVLVKTGPDQYREIIHVQRTTMDQAVGPTTIVKAGKDSILNARASVGIKSYTYGDYFWLGEDGPILVNVDEPAIAAGMAFVPPGKRIYGLVEIDFPTLTATLAITNQNAALCCTGDRIVVRFHLHQGKVTITGARYVGPPAE